LEDRGLPDISRLVFNLEDRGLPDISRLVLHGPLFSFVQSSDLGLASATIAGKMEEQYQRNIH
jgi:hypothetical protein